MSIIIPHNKLSLSNREKTNVIKVLKSEWIAQGNEVKLFENEICAFLDIPKGHAVAVSSCSMAMYVSLKVLKAKNKTVGIPVYVSRVLRGAIGTLGAKEKLYDISSNDPNIDLELVNKNPPNFLIIPHMYGIPLDLSNFKSSIVIENCAHSLGAKINKVPVGLQRDLGVLSFQATKLITSGGMGGMVISRNKELIKKIRKYRDFDNSKEHDINLNIKMTDLHASIGRTQLKKLKEFISKRDKIFTIYNKSNLNLLGSEIDKRVKPVRYRAVVKTKNPTKLIKNLKNNGIGAIVPIARWELLSKSKKFKNAIKLCKSTVSIPIYPKLSLAKAKIISQLVYKFQ